MCYEFWARKGSRLASFGATAHEYEVTRRFGHARTYAGATRPLSALSAQAVSSRRHASHDDVAQ